MITRAHILSVIGSHGPCEVADILDKIRRDDTRALSTAAQLAGTHVTHKPGCSYVALVETTLARTTEGKWYVVPLRAAQLDNAPAAMAILVALGGGQVVSANYLAMAAGEAVGPLLVELVTERLIEPHTHLWDAYRRCTPDEWLYGLPNEAANSMHWTYTEAS